MGQPTPLSSFRVRPRFEQTVATPRGPTRDILVRGLATHAPHLVVKPFAGFIGIHIADRQRRYWSPRLFLSLYDTPEGGTRIEDVYGPEIEIWGVFLYGYIISGMLGTFSGILGGAQLLIGAQPWGFWIAAGMAVAALLLYLAAQLGQKLGAWQTIQLHQAYTAAIAGTAPDS